MGECRSCEMQKYLACQNSAYPGSCHKSEISPLYSAESGPAARYDSLESSGGFSARNQYDDAAQRIKDLQKKIQDLRDQEDIDDSRALVENLEEYFKLSAEVKEFQNLQALLAEVKEQLRRRRSVEGEIVMAWRKSDKSHTAAQLEKLFEVHSITQFEDYFSGSGLANLRRLIWR